MNLEQQIREMECQLNKLRHELETLNQPLEPRHLRTWLGELDQAQRNLSSRLIKLEKFARAHDEECAVQLGIVEEIPF